MRTLSELNNDISFNREMNELMNILRQTAVIEFQALFNRRKGMGHFEKYVGLIQEFFKIEALKHNHHPLFTNPKNKVLVIFITTDMGFLGGLNTEIIETGLRQLTKRDEAHILVIGDKGYNYLEDFGKSFDYLGGISNEVRFNEAEKIRDYVYAFSIKNNIGRVIISYPRFISFSRQEIDMFTLIPCGYLFESQTEPGQEPKAPVTPRTAAPRVPYLFEPYLDKVIDYLIRTWVGLKIYDILWHSKLSEFSARAMHLDSSMDELKEMKKDIQRQYFKSKHEIADRTIRDIFGGRRMIINRKKNSK
ncbi:MAG: FoF1 ATP synthase subunit gamma [Candidatus Brocadiia bacterium]